MTSEEEIMRSRTTQRNRFLGGLLLGLVALAGSSGSGAEGSGYGCGAGTLRGGGVLVLCQEMPPFPFDVSHGIVQEGPETSPTVVEILCRRVAIANERQAGTLVRPATIYANARSILDPETLFLIKVVDRGIVVRDSIPQPDEAGVVRIFSSTDIANDGSCGAALVQTAPVVGNFYGRNPPASGDNR